MPAPKPPIPLPFLKGQKILAGPIEVMRKAVEWVVSKTIVGVAAPLQLRETPGGSTISLIEMPAVFDRTIGVTSSAFLARSGATQASGTVTPYKAVAAALSSRGEGTVTAYNFTGGTIATGVPVIMLLIDGQWQIISADCSGVPI
jgi:hypothetical protein